MSECCPEELNMRSASFVSEATATVSPQGSANIARAQAYLRAIEQGAVGEEFSRFFAEDVVQEELPNRIVPTGARRMLADILAAAVRGQAQHGSACER